MHSELESAKYRTLLLDEQIKLQTLSMVVAYLRVGSDLIFWYMEDATQKAQRSRE